MSCSPPDEKDVSLGRIMTLYRRNVQIYYSLVADITRNQCHLQQPCVNFLGGNLRAFGRCGHIPPPVQQCYTTIAMVSRLAVLYHLPGKRPVFRQNEDPCAELTCVSNKPFQ